ncbi:Sulfotransferase domain protein [Roseimaritima multifibrata]|uniref:Sulfotransferase domain protein n=1 Tax=Roseimaritima multifibrata TaxID=1930274 RepID=A0A517MN85_9BACT|nr:sulfotransferase [Roseimaritima multifibrata]QDS96345.1 Sulfotransferase domain protein [Roseimaritima multifibrata]
MTVDAKKFPIFVSGTQRSGTTLMHRILECSSDVWSCNEMYEVHEFVFGGRSRDRLARLRNELGKFLDVQVEDFNYGEGQDDPVALLATAMELAAARANKPRWCLKDPAVTYYLDEYAEAFPNARFVIMVRDPRAVCRSYLSPVGFTVGRPANWVSAAQRCHREMQRQLAFAQKCPGRVLFVNYESMVSQLDKELGRVCQFIGIQYEPAMQFYYKHQTDMKIHSGNENILTAPDISKAEKWKRTLTDRQVKTVEAIALDSMQAFGYQPMFSRGRVSATRFLIARVHDRFVREYRWQKYKFLSK